MTIVAHAFAEFMPGSRVFEICAVAQGVFHVHEDWRCVGRAEYTRGAPEIDILCAAEFADFYRIYCQPDASYCVIPAMVPVTVSQTESQMGRRCDETIGQFLESLKKAGVEISNEGELRARLEEVQRWHYAFITLASNGRLIGISFSEQGRGINEGKLRETFERYNFPDHTDTLFTAALKAAH